MTSETRDRSVFEALDNGFHLLRELPASAWLVYLVGAVPFLLALLWAATEISILYTPEKGVENALLCAVTFVWMQGCRVRFAELLECKLGLVEPAPWTAGRAFRCLCLQAGFQTAKLVMMPLAALTFVPWAWIASFFRNVTVLVSRPVTSVLSLIGKAAQLSSSNHRQTWFLMALVGVIGFFVFLNIGILILILPALTRALSGFENQFTRGTGNVFTWRLLETACGFTWLMVDPLVQAITVESIYRAEAVNTGADLLNALRRPMMAAALVLVCFGAAARADVSPPVLKHRIEQVLQERQYSWQESGKEQAEESLGFFGKIARSVQRGIQAIGSAIEAAAEWIRQLFMNNPGDEGAQAKPAAPRSVRWVVFALAGVIALSLVVFFVRSRRVETVPVAEVATAHVDIEDESVGAADLPEDGWLRMAQDCAGRDEYRLALRALYLATLAHLGQRNLLTLVNSKTNRDYQRELRRRAPDQQLQQHFRESVLRFESAWYGRRETGEQQLATYRENFEAVRAHAN